MHRCYSAHAVSEARRERPYSNYSSYSFSRDTLYTKTAAKSAQYNNILAHHNSNLSSGGTINTIYEFLVEVSTIQHCIQDKLAQSTTQGGHNSDPNQSFFLIKGINGYRFPWLSAVSFPHRDHGGPAAVFTNSQMSPEDQVKELWSKYTTVSAYASAQSSPHINTAVSLYPYHSLNAYHRKCKYRGDWVGCGYTYEEQKLGSHQMRITPLRTRSERIMTLEIDETKGILKAIRNKNSEELTNSHNWIHTTPSGTGKPIHTTIRCLWLLGASGNGMIRYEASAGTPLSVLVADFCATYSIPIKDVTAVGIDAVQATQYALDRRWCAERVCDERKDKSILLQQLYESHNYDASAAAPPNPPIALPSAAPVVDEGLMALADPDALNNGGAELVAAAALTTPPPAVAPPPPAAPALTAEDAMLLQEADAMLAQLAEENNAMDIGTMNQEDDDNDDGFMGFDEPFNSAGPNHHHGHFHAFVHHGHTHHHHTQHIHHIAHHIHHPLPPIVLPTPPPPPVAVQPLPQPVVDMSAYGSQPVQIYRFYNPHHNSDPLSHPGVTVLDTTRSLGSLGVCEGDVIDLLYHP